jgi:phytol kinase
MVEEFALPDLLRPVAFTAAVGLLWVATGRLRERGVGRDGDVRKVNHVAAFAGGALVFGWLPEPTARISLYAVGVELLVLVAVVCRFRGRPPFRQAFAANTRAADAPHEAFHFWSSWLISLLALAAIDLVFGRMAVTRTAALIVGVADGLGEPIGRRFGRHRYRVPAPVGRPAVRSVEGSLAVLVGALAVLLAATSPGRAGVWGWVLAAAGIAVAVAAVEAVSPRGTDNGTVPLASAWLVHESMAAAWLA